jgi:hypothetical protein
VSQLAGRPASCIALRLRYKKLEQIYNVRQVSLGSSPPRKPSRRLKMFAAALVAAVVALPQVLAHGGVLSYNIAGTTYGGWSPYNSASGQT